MSVMSRAQCAAFDADVLLAVHTTPVPVIKDLTPRVAQALLRRREPWATGVARDQRLLRFVRTALVRLEAAGALTCDRTGPCFRWAVV